MLSWDLLLQLPGQLTPVATLLQVRVSVIGCYPPHTVSAEGCDGLECPSSEGLCSVVYTGNSSDNSLNKIFLLVISKLEGMYRRGPPISPGTSIFVTWKIAASAPVTVQHSMQQARGKAKGKRACRGRPHLKEIFGIPTSQPALVFHCQHYLPWPPLHKGSESTTGRPGYLQWSWYFGRKGERAYLPGPFVIYTVTLHNCICLSETLNSWGN